LSAPRLCRRARRPRPAEGHHASRPPARGCPPRPPVQLVRAPRQGRPSSPRAGRITDPSRHRRPCRAGRRPARRRGGRLTLGAALGGRIVEGAPAPRGEEGAYGGGAASSACGGGGGGVAGGGQWRYRREADSSARGGGGVAALAKPPLSLSFLSLSFSSLSSLLSFSRGSESSSNSGERT
jgi:hypothetical protein